MSSLRSHPGSNRARWNCRLRWERRRWCRWGWRLPPQVGRVQVQGQIFLWNNGNWNGWVLTIDICIRAEWLMNYLIKIEWKVIPHSRFLARTQKRYQRPTKAAGAKQSPSWGKELNEGEWKTPSEMDIALLCYKWMGLDGIVISWWCKRRRAPFGANKCVFYDQWSLIMY